MKEETRLNKKRFRCYREEKLWSLDSLSPQWGIGAIWWVGAAGQGCNSAWANKSWLAWLLVGRLAGWLATQAAWLPLPGPKRDAARTGQWVWLVRGLAGWLAGVQSGSRCISQSNQDATTCAAQLVGTAWQVAVARFDMS